jgi:hypothetical protein
MSAGAPASLAEWFRQHRGHRIRRMAGTDEETGETVIGLGCEVCGEFLVEETAVHPIVPDESGPLGR